MARDGSLILAPDHLRPLVVHLAEHAANFEIDEKIITAAIRARAGIASESNLKTLSNLQRALAALYDPGADFGDNGGERQMNDLQKKYEALPDVTTVHLNGGRP
jgi:hypothetical protein